MGLSFTFAAGSRQGSHSQFRVSRDSWPHFTLSDSRLPPPGGPGPRIYIPQEQGGPVYTPRHWVQFSLPNTTRRATVEVFEPPPHEVQLFILETSIMLRPTASRLICLGINHPFGAYYQIFITVSWVFVDVGRSLWREDGSVVYNCCWPSPAQSFSGPSPVVIVIIFYCLRFETSLFVASYDSQGYGGGIRLRLHKSKSKSKSSQSHTATDCQSVSKSWYRAPSGVHDQIFISVWQLRSCFRRAPSLTRARVCLLYVPLVLASAVFLGS
jgi:hypothetical protein